MQSIRVCVLLVAKVWRLKEESKGSRAILFLLFVLEVEDADLYLCNLADDRGRSGSEILGVYVPAGAQQTIPLIDGVFHLTYIENRGAAFSLFAQFDSRWIFVVLAIVITVAIFTAIYKNMLQTQLGCWSLILVAAGALGNAIDRVAHGFVVDMFDFRLISFSGHC